MEIPMVGCDVAPLLDHSEVTVDLEVPEAMSEVSVDFFEVVTSKDAIAPAMEVVTEDLCVPGLFVCTTSDAIASAMAHPTSALAACDGRRLDGDLHLLGLGTAVSARPPGVASPAALPVLASHVGAHRLVSGKDRGRPPDAWATSCLAPPSVREAFMDGKKNEFREQIKNKAWLRHGLLAFSVAAPSVVPGLPSVSWREGGKEKGAHA
jgi:hypothetical protein